MAATSFINNTMVAVVQEDAPISHHKMNSLCQTMRNQFRVSLQKTVYADFFTAVKFCPQQYEQRTRIIDRALTKLNMEVPEGVSQGFFHTYYCELVSKGFSSLRHNASSLAWRNYKSKLTNKWFP